MTTLPQSTLNCLQLTTDAELDELEAIIGTQFTQRALLAQAITHRSCQFTVKGKAIIQCNEKLEHLGDKVVGLAACKFLHLRYPEESESFYTQVLNIAVSNNVLSEASKPLGLERFLITKSETNLTSRTISADIVEAIAAALFLDQGSDAVDRFLSQFLYPKIEEIVAEKMAGP